MENHQSQGGAMPLNKGIVQEHALDRMPILGDSLQDSWCHDSQVLEHLDQECTLADWTLWNLLGLNRVSASR